MVIRSLSKLFFPGLSRGWGIFLLGGGATDEVMAESIGNNGRCSRFLLPVFMKKPILCTLLFLSATSFLLSCTKEVAQSEVIKEIIIDTTIQQGAAFRL